MSHRIIATLLVGLATVGAGCMRKDPISPDAVPAAGKDRPNVEITLSDGTIFRMESARTVDESVCGSLVSCAGASCKAVRADRCVAKEKIASIEARTVNGTGVAVGVTAAVLGTVALTALAVAATSRPSSPSSTSGSDSNGARGGGFGSCPRIYAWNGAGWQLDSGTFGVSYFEAAPRTDFDRLDHLVSDHGTYRLRLVNEQDETEHTDLVRLSVIDHPAGTRVVPTAAGKLLTFRDEASPTTALDFRGRDALALVTTKDDHEWSSDLRDRHAMNAADARDGLRLVFPKPKGAKTAKLRLAAHNTDWAGHMLGYLLAHRGTTLPDWWSAMNTNPRARATLEEFLVREGMLNVRVKTPAGWATRGVFWAAGSEIVKEEAFELAVGDLPGDTLEIELESALDFWSVDAASVAYGENERVVIHELSASSAHTNAGRDVTSVLARADSVRFDTVRGDVAELAFDAPGPGASGSVRSFVLETNGYYVPEVAPAADADPAAMDALMETPFAASRLALAFRIATRPRPRP